MCAFFVSLFSSRLRWVETKKRAEDEVREQKNQANAPKQIISHFPLAFFKNICYNIIQLFLF